MSLDASGNVPSASIADSHNLSEAVSAALALEQPVRSTALDRQRDAPLAIAGGRLVHDRAAEATPRRPANVGLDELPGPVRRLRVARRGSHDKVAFQLGEREVALDLRIQAIRFGQ